MQQFDQAPVEADAIESSLATIVQGSTAPSAFSVGKYIYLKHNSTLDPGLYRVKSAIAQGDTLSSSNLEQDSEGVVNALNSNKQNKIVFQSYSAMTVNSGYIRFSLPTGITSASHSVVITPIYGSDSIPGWSYSIQYPSASEIIMYVRLGASLPTDGTKISFKICYIPN